VCSSDLKRGLEQGGAHISDVVVSEYKVNSGLKQEEIEKRP